ncbi:hypothetical protein [Corallococcus sp. EGB]|uniref:hypothetical protein n=1 Tax=Corallococcus sp. EGB TaxID=1521117 RepID=UPI001CBB2398
MGASAGLGAVFARELAARGMALILVASSGGRMRALGGADEGARHPGGGPSAGPGPRERGPRAARALPAEMLRVDLLINNAASARREHSSRRRSRGSASR